jgi:2-amino-4-hydroxy-6-hydroxymethyldihydropteridine diphosphokinase
MATIYLGIGSNIDPEQNIPAALHRLAEARMQLKAVSTFYRTAPLDSPGAPPFYNGVVQFQVRMSPRALKFNLLRKIEEALGRKRTADKNAPRPIDLDILLYGNRVVRMSGLRIPDPDIVKRPFLAIPLHELAPDLILPDNGRHLAECLPVRSADMMPLLDFTARLRESLQ